MVGIIKAVPRNKQIGVTMDGEPIHITQYEVLYADGSTECMSVKEYFDLLYKINKPADGVL